MKLYYSKGACSLATRIIIYELGIPCEFESVNLKTKKTETKSNFLKINEKGAVPTLVLDSEEVLTENAVIQQYLADHYKATHLLPPLGNFRRYRVLEWLNFISTDVHKIFGSLFSADLSEEIKDSVFRPIIKRKFDFINARLSKQSYLVGEAFTLADSYMFAMIRWTSPCKIDVSKLSNLTRYFKELQQRSSIQKALIDEELIS